MLKSLATSIAALALMGAAAPDKPGVHGRHRPVSEFRPAFSHKLGTAADWVVITASGAWVGAAGPNAVYRIAARTGRVDRRVALPDEACAGLAAGFGSLWVPLCGAQPRIARIDLHSGRIVALLPFGPPAEASIAVGGDSVWLAIDAHGTLARIDPRTNRIRQRIRLVSGSMNPVADGNSVWVTSTERNRVTKVDARSGAVLGAAPTGPGPRFVTVSAGSVWTLNQGDGSVTRIASHDLRVKATIALGIPGHGGDIAFGGGYIWATSIGVPLTALDPRTNQVVAQWVGPGGDSLRFGHGSIWLTDYKRGFVQRLPLPSLRLPH